MNSAIKSIMPCIICACLVASCAQVKESGRAIGHATRDATRAVGHAARDTTRAIGHTTRDIVKGDDKGKDKK